ncbi:MAG: hypothetical protein ACRD9R_04040 [Pyrinomonadaceae bacterium]
MTDDANVARHAKVITAMVVNITPKLTALEAEAAASLFLSDSLPDRLTAGQPRLDTHAGVWRVPVLLAYPLIGDIGEVGEVVVNGQTKEVLSHTPVPEMLARARALYEQHRDTIEAPVSSSFSH